MFATLAVADRAGVGRGADALGRHRDGATTGAAVAIGPLVGGPR